MTDEGVGGIAVTSVEGATFPPVFGSPAIGTAWGLTCCAAVVAGAPVVLGVSVGASAVGDWSATARSSPRSATIPLSG